MSTTCKLDVGHVCNHEYCQNTTLREHCACGFCQQIWDEEPEPEPEPAPEPSSTTGESAPDPNLFLE